MHELLTESLSNPPSSKEAQSLVVEVQSEELMRSVMVRLQKPGFTDCHAHVEQFGDVTVCYALLHRYLSLDDSRVVRDSFPVHFRVIVLGMA